MNGYFQVNLISLIEQIGEDKTQEILTDFSCPMNIDVEEFLKDKAVLFAQQQISATHLIFTSYKNSTVLVGYYTLAPKIIAVNRRCLSKRLQKRIAKFAQFDQELKRYHLVATLIGQLGKNFKNNYNNLITGDELLLMACQKIKRIQMELGGKIVYLECEDKPVLTEFYERNGFVTFGQRRLDSDEVDKFEGGYLIQMLKYL
ncbi:MAG TPA: N-acetyltransferase [Firmicutes bacterium]|nr:N-acetyltransferase [Bacillota bacterium]